MASFLAAFVAGYLVGRILVVSRVLRVSSRGLRVVVTNRVGDVFRRVAALTGEEGCVDIVKYSGGRVAVYVTCHRVVDEILDIVKFGKRPERGRALRWFVAGIILSRRGRSGLEEYVKKYVSEKAWRRVVRDAIAYIETAGFRVPEYVKRRVRGGYRAVAYRLAYRFAAQIVGGDEKASQRPGTTWRHKLLDAKSDYILRKLFDQANLDKLYEEYRRHGVNANPADILYRLLPAKVRAKATKYYVAAKRYLAWKTRKTRKHEEHEKPPEYETVPELL